MTNRLAIYRKKRDFTKTGEPRGGRARASAKHPIFIIQKHAATRLHYDFRLEEAGVLKSWAVPKGPSLNPSEKRLAVQTEDHPFEYATFEGVIPEGQYGAGNVILWDRGWYLNLTQKNGRPLSVSEGLSHGHIRFWIEGRKIKGGFTLTRMGRDEKSWILVKSDDKEADRRSNPVATRPESVVSGKRIEQIDPRRARRWR